MATFKKRLKGRPKSPNVEDRRKRQSAFTKKGVKYSEEFGLSNSEATLAAYINAGMVKPGAIKRRKERLKKKTEKGRK